MAEKENLRLLRLEEDVSSIKKDVKVISDSVTKMSLKFYRDEETGEEGFFAMMTDTRVRLSRLENFKFALLVLYGGVSGLIGALIFWKLTV